MTFFSEKWPIWEFHDAISISYNQFQFAVSQSSSDHNIRNEKFKLLKQAAESGSSEALYKLGQFYENDLNIPIIKNAEFYYELSALKGHSESQVSLGNLYRRLYGDLRNNVKAFKYYKMAADQGNFNGEVYLGECFQIGIGTEISLLAAFKYFKSSVAHGGVDALIHLANAYKRGFSGLKSMRYAKFYADMYVDRSLDLAMKCDFKRFVDLGNIYYRGYGVEKSNEKAYKYYKMGVDKNETYALSFLGDCYDKGIGVEKSEERAYHYYKLSSDQGEIRGLLTLAVKLSQGINGIKSHQDAVEYCRMVLAKTRVRPDIEANSAANYILAQFYENGTGVKTSYKNALYFYKCAANNGFCDALHKLGDIYKGGLLGTTPSYENAFHFYKRLADLNDDRGQYNLGKCYGKGLGVEKSEEMALHYYKLSADQGNQEAISGLANHSRDGVWR